MNTFEGSNLVLCADTNLASAGRIMQDSPLLLVRGNEPNAKSTNPALTVVVVAYQHENYIEQCLSSINSTFLQTFELIIIDDGSSDQTLNKCLDFRFRPGIDVSVYTKPNHGLVHSLFYGLELAQGQYLSFMASDDLYIEGGLDFAIHYLQTANPPIDALLCQAVAFDSDDEVRLVYGPAMDKFFSDTPFERFDVICTSPPRPMLLQATIFRTIFLRNLRPWSDNLVLDDWPTFIRLFAAEAYHAAIVRYEPTLKLCLYRINARGLHNNLDRQLKITTQIASLFVPLKYRKICLANAIIGNGLIHIYEGRWCKGTKICLQGIITCPTFPVISLLMSRAWKFVWKRVRLAIGRR